MLRLRTVIQIAKGGIIEIAYMHKGQKSPPDLAKKRRNTMLKNSGLKCEKCNKDYIRGKRKVMPNSKLCRDCYRQEWRLEYGREKVRAYRMTCLIYYGGDPPKCKCCGESEIKFLAIDHIDGNGKKHSQSIKKALPYWLIQNNFPKGFQILCHNCNLAKGFYGACPHGNCK